MTAILGFVRDGMPILIGDILLSSPIEYAPSTINLPTVGNLNNFEPDNKLQRISDFRQKIIVLAPNLAFAWAGQLDVAQAMLREIGARHALKPFNRHTIFPFIEFHWPVICRQSPLSLIGYLVDDEGVRSESVYSFSVGKTINKVQSSTHGEIRLAGTGGWDLLGHLRHEHSFPPAPDRSSPQFKTIAMAITLISESIKHELHHMDSLRLQYGGGYEVMGHWDNSFQKLPELTQVMWYTDYRDGRILLDHIYFIVKHQYIDNNLVIRSLCFDESNSGVPLRSWQTIVPPVLSSDMPTALTGLDHALSLHSSMFAHLVLIRHKANSTATIVSMIENRKPERFHLEETEQGIVSHIAPDWRGELEDIINREVC